MLRITQNRSSAGAKSYFSRSDYYTEGQELVGQWRGLGAARLGLTDTVRAADWDALCDNLNPATRRPLTVRSRQDRSVGYDFTFDVPKSVSLLHAVTGDERLMTAFRACVNETMQEMEREMQTRVRRGGKDEDRTTGNMVWGEFVHLTSRPVDGIPDPQLHAHCFVFNATYDAIEHRWKAAQFRGLKRDAPYWEAVCHAKLAARLADLGLPIERSLTGWELRGLDRSTLLKFSRRTKQIEAEAVEKGVTANPEHKAELGARTREKKQKTLPMEELRRVWKDQLTTTEQDDLATLARRIGGPAQDREREAPARAARYAVDHSFERQSVVPERTLLREALRRGYGEADRASVERAVQESDLIRVEREGRIWVTTRAVLDDESAMLAFARDGRGRCSPINAGAFRVSRDWLGADQKAAVAHVLRSRDRVMLIRGAAGVGKTTLMQEAVEQMKLAGVTVSTFAPSASASRGVLRDAGFATADTVARLLADEKMQEQVRGHVLWIDEASLLGVRTLRSVFTVAESLGCRVILGGDVRQHGPVEAGNALRVLETESGLVPAEVVKIQRQSGEYRRAVEAISEGRISDGFRQLERLGAVKQVDDEQRYEAIAHEYVAAVEAGEEVLVVSPTHHEGARATQAIRAAMRRAGRLGAEERSFDTLVNANLTVAQRSDLLNLSLGDTLVYHQNAMGHRKGERVVVGQRALRLDQAARYTVFRRGKIALRVGDIVRITRNGATREGKPLNNGDTHAILGFSEEGHLDIGKGRTIDKDFGYLTNGSVITSHASQGRSVDRVIVVESSASLAAASREQFYVSVSRGKKAVSIYTDDKEALLEAVQGGDTRLSATELVSGRDVGARARHNDRVESLRPPVPAVTIVREGHTHER